MDARSAGPQEDCWYFWRMICSPEFQRCWQTVNKRYVEKGEFLAMTAPVGMTPGETWEVLRELRRQSGLAIPYPTEPQLWCNLPQDDRGLASEIVARSSVLSSKNSYMMNRDFRRIDTESQVRELICVLNKDGFHVEYEDVRAVYLGRRGPFDDVERVIANYGHILKSEMIADNCKGDVAAIYASLIEGAGRFEGTSNLPAAARQLSKSMLVSRRPASADVVLCLSAHLAEVPPAFKIFPSFNACIGTLLRKVFFLRRNLTALALLSLGQTLPDSQGGGSQVFDVKGNPSAWDVHATNYDLTYYFHGYFLELDRMLSHLEERIDRLIAIEDMLLGEVEKALTLNYRQKSITKRFIQGWSGPITAASCSKQYAVTVRTAATDLAGLVNLGIITQIREQKGEAAYRPAEDMRMAIGGLL